MMINMAEDTNDPRLPPQALTQPEWARAHDVLNAIREDMHARRASLFAQRDAISEEINHVEQVIERIDSGDSMKVVAANSASVGSASPAQRRW